MYKNTCLFFCIITFSTTIQLCMGQFSLPSFGGGGDSGGYGGRFKLGQSLAGSLGQMMTGQGFNFGSLQSGSSGFGQILGSLINGASSSGSSSGGGGPLSQLATAASNQYINAIRSSPLLSQFTQSQSQQPPASMSPYGSPGSAIHGGPPSPHLPPHSAMSGYNPMALLGGDSSMYGPPGPPHSGGGGYDSHFGGSNIFPQYAAPGNYYNQYGPGPNVAMPPSPLYSGSSSPYGGHIPSPIHHLDRKK